MDYTLILNGSCNDDCSVTFKCFLRVDQELLGLAKEGVDYLKNNPKADFVLYGVEAKDVFFADNVPDEISILEYDVDKDVVTSKFNWEKYRDMNRAGNAPLACHGCGVGVDKCESCEYRKYDIDTDEAAVAFDKTYKSPVELVEMHVQVRRMHIDEGAFEIYFRSEDADEDEPNGSDYWVDCWCTTEEIESAIKLLEDGKDFVELERPALPF